MARDATAYAAQSTASGWWGWGTSRGVRSGNCPSLSWGASRRRADRPVSDVSSWRSFADVSRPAGLNGWQNGRYAAWLWSTSTSWLWSTPATGLCATI